jgi:hypothetical protein
MFFMKKALLMLLATAVVGLSVAPLTADASVKKNGKHVKSTVQLKKSTAQLKSKSKSKSKKNCAAEVKVEKTCPSDNSYQIFKAGGIAFIERFASARLRVFCCAGAGPGDRCRVV